MFGRRLSVCCVGLGGRWEDMAVMKEMVLEARAYGAIATFNKPSMNADSLSQIASRHISSLVSTKTELTANQRCRGQGDRKMVRSDILRERTDCESPEDGWPTEDWWVFRAGEEECYVKSIFKWNRRDDDFCTVLDRRCFRCFQLVADHDWNTASRGSICPGCKACCVCSQCEPHGRSKCMFEADRRRKGAIDKEYICSYNVAWKSACFGEGAERLAYKFRFLNEDDEFIGPAMVAKESRFVEQDSRSEQATLLSHRHTYHFQFMRTQALASQYADEYNNMLDLKTERYPRLRSRINRFPRITFLKPLVFELVDSAADKRYELLVEPLIEGNYKKYNGNFGNVAKGETRSDDDASVQPGIIELLLSRKAKLAVVSEESEDEECDDDNLLICQHGTSDPLNLNCNDIPDENFAHAFSHFTYHTSNEQLMVVDLQGSLKIYPDQRRKFVFTDPAVHKRKARGHSKA